jgi:hypothetical protein
MEKINQKDPTQENIEKAKKGREFLNSERGEYKRIKLDILVQYPTTIGTIINDFEHHFNVEQDKIESGYAKLTLNNRPEND